MIDGGKNLLLHGENGSGKSSIYLALKRFFEERGDDIAKHCNHFSPDTRISTPSWLEFLCIVLVMGTTKS